MQVLKEEIRNKIIDTAEQMFYEKGFGQASMRSIADEVGISVSNLYLYYKNKEALFAGVVDHFYRFFVQGFDSFIDHRDEGEAHMDVEVIKALRKMITSNPKKFVILMDKSAGTRYEGIKKEIIQNILHHILSQLKSNSNYEEVVISIIADNFFNAVIEIAKQYQDEKWLERALHTLIQYHMKGMDQFL